MVVGCNEGPETLVGWFFDKAGGPLVAGLVLSFVGGWFITQMNERYKSRRDLYFKSIDALRDNIDKFVDLSTAYWNSGHGQDSVIQEAKLEFIFSDISSLTRICSGHLWSKEEDEGPKLVGALGIAALGASTYMSPSRTPDVRQIQRITVAAAHLSHFITGARSAYFHQNDTIRWLRGASLALKRHHRLLVLLTLIIGFGAISFLLSTSG